MPVFIGIDVGTSGAKALAIGTDGAVRSSASAGYPLYTPRPLWSEQDPQDWWRATVEAVKACIGHAGLTGSEVAGIGLTGQMHGLVLLDESNRVLRRAILWNDQRTAAECEEITRLAGGYEALIRLVKNPALTGFTAPKILWVRRNEPEVYAKAARILLPKDFVRFRMTGTYATDVSDASGMLLLDMDKRNWSEEMLRLLDLERSMLADVFEGPEETGRLEREPAEALGLPAGIPVAAGGGDQAAGAVGNGIVRRGVVSATMGTSGVVFAHADEPLVDPEGRLHTFCHAVPGKWHMMGVVLSAGGSFQWFRNVLGSEETAVAARMGVDPYVLLTAQAAQAPAGAEGLVFLPYLTGERTPHKDPYARGAFVGLTLRHTKAHLARAVLEGAAFAMRDSLELTKSAGVPIQQIRVSGGGARSELWRSIQADVYGQAVVTVNAVEGPAYGAALLAGTMAGAWPSIEAACDAGIRVAGSTPPNPQRAAEYEALYRVYRSLYPRLKQDMRSLAELGGR